MKAPLIIIFIFLVTALEALTDGLIYHAWVDKIPGENSIWDAIYKAVPMLSNPLVRIFATFPAVYILIKKF